jgi:aconitate hydratase
MINGIGVLGWGVGGLEAQSVMFGMPTMLRIPEVTGVRLTGVLRTPALSTDLALTVTARLRALDVSGQFVEFFGPGVAGLTAGDRAVVANMAPEYGATTGYFAIDEQTLAYLRATGRSAHQVALVEAYARRIGLWHEARYSARYSRVIEIALDEIGRAAAGPSRPHDLLPASGIAAALGASADGHPVAIAAITSCTNTSDPRLLVAAGLLAKKARALGLRPAAWVKTSLAPGSPAAAGYLRSAGVLEDLEALGFGIVGYGCTTCIGNSGPLTAPMRALLERGGKPVAILSGNRNFAGRVHPDLERAFLVSPPLVVAYAIAGDASRNFDVEPVGTSAFGSPVFLRDLWPGSVEIDRALRLDASAFRSDFEAAARNPAWHALPAPAGARFPWDPASNYLQRPPFASNSQGSQLGSYTAFPLLVLGDDVTTDHISPASAIPPTSLVADYLAARGEDRGDLNVFASRRGNWQVMLRAAFHSRSLVNHLHAGMPMAHTLHVPTGEVLPIWQAAQRYRDAGEAVVLVAGERYGTGSSRDWAAKGLRLLGVRAVLATSFERIHRSNLIGMGILPLRLAPGALQGGLEPGDRLSIAVAPELLCPRMPVTVTLERTAGGPSQVVATAAVETELEVRLLRAGGVLPMIVGDKLRAGRG